MESAIWVGGREFTSATPSSKGYMGGILEFLSTNVNASVGTLSLTGFDEDLQAILQDGDMNKVIFSAPPSTSGHPKVETWSREPAISGETALARLRGTLVILAAAALSSGGTIDIT
jgi:hypothetical protein